MELENTNSQQLLLSKNRTKVQVAVRIRPFIIKEVSNHQQKCIKVKREEKLLAIGSGNKYHHFKFDHIFDCNSNQNEIYKSCVEELIKNTFDGYNATILAYGQTGSGKTYTMGTQDLIINGADEKLGIIPRVIKQIFQKKMEIKEKTKVFIKVTFIEIYNEEIHDLLDTSLRLLFLKNYNFLQRASSIQQISSSQCIIREDKDGQITLCGLVEQSVNCFDQMKQCLELGILHRKTSSTLLNESSSRSHAIFSILMTQEDVETQTIKTSKLHLVDLAGSERLSRTHAQGITQKEGININKGLLALGNVIVALTERDQNRFVPYRDSKLTRILQDSLGGNSLTCMIACVSPAEENVSESLSTLNYAFRAMNIQNLVGINLEQSEENNECERLRAQIRSLNAERSVLVQKVAQLAVARDKFVTSEFVEQKLKKELDHALIKIDKLKEVLQSSGINMPQEMEFKEYDKELEKVQKELQLKEQECKELQGEYLRLVEQGQIERELLNRKQQRIVQLEEKIARWQRQEAERQLSGSKIEPEEEESEEDNEECTDDAEFDQYAAKEIDLLEGTLSIKQQDLENKEAYLTELEQNIAGAFNQNYCEKISELNIQLQDIIKQRDNAIKKLASSNVESGQNKQNSLISKYKSNINELQSKLKEFKQKEKVQQNMCKQIGDQKNKVKSLTDEINKMKTQKSQLQKNFKQEQDKYEKLKQEKNREYLQMKRKNMQKDNEIIKLQNQHKLKQLRLQRKTNELENRLLSQKLLQKILRTKKTKRQAYFTTGPAFRKTMNKLSEQSKQQLSEEQAEELIEFATSRLLQSMALEQQIQEEENKYSELEKEQERILYELCELILQKDKEELAGAIDSNKLKDLNSQILSLKEVLERQQTEVECIEVKLKSLNKLSSTESLAQIESLLITNEDLSNNQLLLKLFLNKFLCTIRQKSQSIEKLQQQVLALQEKSRQFSELQGEMRVLRGEYELQIATIKRESDERVNDLYRRYQFKEKLEGKWKDVEDLRKQRRGIRAKENNLDKFLKEEMEKLEEIMMSVPRKKKTIDRSEKKLAKSLFESTNSKIQIEESNLQQNNEGLIYRIISNQQFQTLRKTKSSNKISNNFKQIYNLSNSFSQIFNLLKC